MENPHLKFFTGFCLTYSMMIVNCLTSKTICKTSKPNFWNKKPRLKRPELSSKPSAKLHTQASEPQNLDKKDHKFRILPYIGSADDMATFWAVFVCHPPSLLTITIQHTQLFTNLAQLSTKSIIHHLYTPRPPATYGQAMDVWEGLGFSKESHFRMEYHKSG